MTDAMLLGFLFLFHFALFILFFCLSLSMWSFLLGGATHLAAHVHIKTLGFLSFSETSRIFSEMFYHSSKRKKWQT